MGLLDDAIREHLELKRAHGADPNEVERQELEALGSPRHGEFASPSGEEAPAAVEADDAARPEPEPEPELEPEPEPEAEGEPDEPEPEAEPAAQAEEPWLEEEPDEVPASDTLEHPQPVAEPDADDVLEETPDFLQETPEHDRLWFEQRPPRDFDWDK